METNYIKSELEVLEDIKIKALRVYFFTTERYKEFTNSNNLLLKEKAYSHYEEVCNLIKGLNNALDSGFVTMYLKDSQNKLLHRIMGVEFESKKLEVDDKQLLVEICLNDKKFLRNDRVAISTKISDIEKSIVLEKQRLDKEFVNSLSHDELLLYIQHYLSKTLDSLKIKNQDNVSEYGSTAFIKSLSFHKLYSFVVLLRNHHFNYSDEPLQIKSFHRKTLSVGHLERLIKLRNKFEEKLHKKDQKIDKNNEKLRSYNFLETVSSFDVAKAELLDSIKNNKDLSSSFKLKEKIREIKEVGKYSLQEKLKLLKTQLEVALEKSVNAESDSLIDYLYDEIQQIKNEIKNEAKLDLKKEKISGDYAVNLTKEYDKKLLRKTKKEFAKMEFEKMNIEMEEAIEKERKAMREGKDLSKQ